MIEFLSNNYKAISTIIIALLGIVIPAWQFILTKKSENRRHNFAAYHRIIEELVGAEDPRIDRQIATVFELRNFPFSVRILEGLKQTWDKPGNYQRLLDEMDLTLDYIKSKLR